jgi:hypothetical protein
MSIISILTRKTPEIAGYQFDAIFEDVLEMESQLTEYPIELGARVSDHRINLPIRYSILVGISNTPLQIIPGVNELITGVAGQISGIASSVAGLSASYLAGSHETRVSAAFDFLKDLRSTGETFTVDTGYTTLTNMAVASISYPRDANTEQAMFARINLQELPTLKTTLRNNAPLASMMRTTDPACSQASAVNNRGEISGLNPSSSTSSQVGGAL